MNQENSVLRFEIGGLSCFELLVLLSAVSVLFFNLGIASLPTVDDAYHAQTAKEMLHSGNFIALQFGGNVSFQSSPLPNWLMAASYAIFGVNEYAARLPSAVCALFTLIAVFAFARNRWGELAGVLSILMLLTSSLFLRYSRHAMAEAPLTLFFTLAIISAYKAYEGNRVYFVCFGLFSGLAVLTKSVMGLFPIIIVVLWLLWSGRIALLVSKGFFRGLLVFLVVISVWYIPAYLLYPDVFIESHLQAYLGNHAVSGHHSDTGIQGYFHYLIWMPIQFLPWTLLLIPALVRSIRNTDESRLKHLLLLTMLVPLVIMSLGSTRYTRYLVPILPAAVLLIIYTLFPVFTRKELAVLQKGVAIVSLILLVVPIVFPLDAGEDVNQDLRRLAPAIERYAPLDSLVLNYKLDFWRYQSPLLFYANTAFSERLETVTQLADAIRPGQYRVGMTNSSSMPELLKTLKGEYQIEVLGTAGQLTAFSLARMTAGQFVNEMEQFYPLLTSMKVRQIMIWKVAVRKLEQQFSRRLDVRIEESEGGPRAVLKRMTDNGIKIGVTWLDQIDSLRFASGNKWDITVLAASEVLAVFQIAQTEGTE